MADPMPVLDMRIFALCKMHSSSGGNRAVAEIVDIWRERGRAENVRDYQAALRHFDGVFDDRDTQEIAALQRLLALRGWPFENGLSLPDIRGVDDNGVGSDGWDYNLRGSPEAIAQGLLVEHPVLLRYPDERLEKSVEIRFTPTGFERLKHCLDDARAGLPAAPVGRAH